MNIQKSNTEYILRPFLSSLKNEEVLRSPISQCPAGEKDLRQSLR